MMRRSLRTMLSGVLVAAITLSSGSMSVMAQNVQETLVEELEVQEAELVSDGEEVQPDEGSESQEKELLVQEDDSETSESDEESTKSGEPEKEGETEQPDEQEELYLEDEAATADSDEQTSKKAEEKAESELLNTDGEAIKLSELAESMYYSFPGFDGGDGTEASPYEISTVEQLSGLFDDFKGVDISIQSHFVLKKDLDLDGYIWDKTAYRNNFDGQNHTISNVKAEGELFTKNKGYIRNLKIKNLNSGALVESNTGTISNIIIENVLSEDQYNNSSYWVLSGSNSGTIENCTLKGTVTVGGNWYEGLVSENKKDGIIDNCVNEAELISVTSHEPDISYYNVGIVCYNHGTVKNCEMNASFSTDAQKHCFGGIVGYNYHEGVIEKCATSDKATFSCYKVGGIVCYNVGTVRECTNHADIEADSYAGGIMADGGTYEYNGVEYSGMVDGCVNHGKVHSKNVDAGGLVGNLNSHNTTVFKIANCLNRGEVVSDNSDAAGIISNGNLDIDNCINEGNVKGKNKCGGIIGDGDNINISNCINLGTITGKYVGGIAGECGSSSEHSIITKSANLGIIWNSDSSGLAGGLVGDAKYCTFSESFSVASIIANGLNVGGLAGKLTYNFTVSDCFAATSGKAEGNGNSGGLFGTYDYKGNDKYDQKMERCYSFCVLTPGNTTHGGFAGSVKSSLSEYGITDCYLLDNGDTVFGGAASDKDGGVVVLSDANMRLQSSFTGYDFTNVWEMGTNEYKYPVLKWYPDVKKSSGEVEITTPDVWGFDNKVEFFGKKRNGYMMSEEDYERLLVESSQTDAKWIGHHAGTKERGFLENRDDWDGSCEGMSRTVALINDGTFNLEQFKLTTIPDLSVSCLYDIKTADEEYSKDAENDGAGIAESVISFYHVQQYIPQIQAVYTKLKNSKTEQYNAVVDLGKELKDNPGKMGIVSFDHNREKDGSGEGTSGHTMAAYGYVDLPNGAQPDFNGHNSEYLHGNDDYSKYTHCILIYDPRNKILLEDGVNSVVNLFYDDSDNWIIPAYISSKDTDGDGNGVELKIATADPDYINTVNYVDGTYAFLEYDPANYNFADAAQAHRFSVDLKKWCEPDQGVLSGDTEGYTALTSNNDGTDGVGDRNTVALPDASTYYVQSVEEGLDAMLYMGDHLVEVKSDVAGDATVETNGTGSITLPEEGTATIGLTANDGHHAIDEPTVYVTASGVKELSAKQVENGVQINGDNLSELSIVATDLFDNGKEILIDTGAHAVQLTKQGDNIEAFSDEDGDGVYETKCGEGAVHITELKLTEDDLLLTPGESHTLVPVTSVEGNKGVEFTWTSDEPEVATVDANGVVKGVAMGTTYITVEAGEYSARCQVDVEKPISGGEAGIPDGLWVSCRNLEDLTYSGAAIKPEVRVYDARTLLTPNTDYTVSYKNNIKAYELGESDAGFAAAKAPCITVTGKGNYSSKETVYFKIQRQSITTEEFAAYDLSLALTGRSQKVSPALYLDGKALKNGTDYSVDVFKKDDAQRTASLGNSVSEPGEYVVRLTGTGNFKDTREVNLVVSGELKPVSKISVGKIAAAQYTGKEITPEPAIKDGTTLLEKDKNYSLSYESNIAVGTGAVIITGIPEGGYSGTKRVTFKITGTPISKAVVEGIPKTVVYSGGEISLEDNISLYIKAGKNTPRIDLQKTDYKVTIENNVNAGKATVIIQGQNGYTGTVKKTFKITPFNVLPASDTKDRFKVTCPDSEYCKGGAKPEITVQFKNADGSFAQLKEGVDFKVTYKNNTVIGGSKNPTATVTGKGNFTGRETVEFAIVQKDLSRVKVNAADKAYKEKANIYATSVALVDTDGKKLKVGTDYEKKLEYTYKYATTVKFDGKDKERAAGEAVDPKDIIPSNTVLTVKATAKGSNYKGEVTGDYRITKASIASATVQGIGAQTYTGKEITFEPKNITVKEKGDVLKPYDESTKKGDFIIKGYTNNLNKGTATVTIEGVGDYFGTKTISFKIKAKGFFWWWRK